MFSSEKYEVIPNGIDFGRFSYNSAKRESLRAELFLDHRVVIGHVGRFVNEKNHEFVIKVFEEYLKQDPNAVLLLIGDGEKREHIHQFVCKKGLEDRVIFTGEVTNVEEYYSAMDVFLFPSLYEGLGIVLIEAQSQGLPCVISERIPSEVVINDNCTALSLNADISVWTDALAKANRIEAISPKMQEYDSCVSAAKLAQIYLQEEKI